MLESDFIWPHLVFGNSNKNTHVCEKSIFSTAAVGAALGQLILFFFRICPLSFLRLPKNRPPRVVVPTALRFWDARGGWVFLTDSQRATPGTGARRRASARVCETLKFHPLTTASAFGAISLLTRTSGAHELHAVRMEAARFAVAERHDGAKYWGNTPHGKNSAAPSAGRARACHLLLFCFLLELENTRHAQDVQCVRTLLFDSAASKVNCQVRIVTEVRGHDGGVCGGARATFFGGWA